MKYVKNINEHNNELLYCDKCGFLLNPDDGSTECKFCSVLGIIGLTKDTDSENIYGQLKYYIKFKSVNLNTYLSELKNKYKIF